MPKTKISKIAKELNISLYTMFEFLKQQNIPVEEHVNARVDDDVVRLLKAEFQSDKYLKHKSSQFTSDRKKDASGSVQRPSGGQELRTASEGHANPKILGVLQFEANGKPIVAKPAETTSEKLQIVKCSNCGFVENPLNSNFCRNCGKKL